MKRICIVVQRYGSEVVGGSESYCRQIASKLSRFFDIEIITTKAKDPTTWHDEYEADVEKIDGLQVRRFSVDHESTVTPELMERCLARSADLNSGYEWVQALGPYSQSLIEYLREHIDDYDAIIIMTYLYYPAVMASLEFGSKSLMIPTAHDEPQIHQPIYRKAFGNVRRFYFLTPEERSFFSDEFGIGEDAMSDGHGGVGVEVPKNVDGWKFMNDFGIKDSPYILYAGRIEEAKGCKRLVQYFCEFKHRNPSDLQLVLIGNLAMDLPDRSDIKYLGFVSEEDKFSAMEGATVFVNPSQFESLSIVVLEAMKVGTPILVNGRCEVLKGHCIRSNGGFYYTNFLEFESLLKKLLLDDNLYQKMRKNAVDYIEDNYTWDAIIDNLKINIDMVIEGYAQVEPSLGAPGRSAARNAC